MKIAHVFALAALPAALAACAGSSPGGGIPAQTYGQHRQTAQSVRYGSVFDTGSGDLHSAGADLGAIAYNGLIQPVGLYNQTQPTPSPKSLFSKTKYKGTANIYYCLTGSTIGKAFFTTGSYTKSGTTITDTGACAPLNATPTGAGARQDPMDFAASSVALLTTDYNTYVQNRQTAYGDAFEFPSIGTPLVYPYKNTDLSGLGTSTLKLSRWTYCAIANGTVADWSDPAVTADNGGKAVVPSSLPITFVFRGDSAGATANYTNHLATVCVASSWTGKYASAPYESSGHSANWTFGGGSTTWPGPGSSGNPNPRFIGETGQPAVVAEIQAVAGATGYIEGAAAAQATRPTLQQASLLNQAGKFENPKIRATILATFANLTYANGQGPDGTITNTNRPDCIFFINPTEFANPSASNAYPIGAVAYLMFYGKGNATHLADDQKLIQYDNSVSGNQLLSALEYAPMPSSMQSIISTAAVTGTPQNPNSPCIST